MKKNVFTKWLLSLCLLPTFSAAGTLAMVEPASEATAEAAAKPIDEVAAVAKAEIEAHMVVPPDEYLTDHGNGVKTFKDVDSYFAWVDSQGLKRVMIVGSSRSGGGPLGNCAKRYYFSKAYNYFLVCLEAYGFPDYACDITWRRNIKTLKHGEWDNVVFEGVGQSEFGKSNALDLLKPGGKLSTNLYYNLRDLLPTLKGGDDLQRVLKEEMCEPLSESDREPGVSTRGEKIIKTLIEIYKDKNLWVNVGFSYAFKLKTCYCAYDTKYRSKCIEDYESYLEEWRELGKEKCKELGKKRCDFEPYFRDAVKDSPLWDEYLKSACGLSKEDVDTEFCVGVHGTDVFPVRPEADGMRAWNRPILVLTKKA